MKPDHYQTLGVAPTSEDVVVRAAYRALIRRYHPDANRSSEAAERARAINAAYAVLGDPDRRANYDSSLAWSEMPEPRPRRAGPIAAGSIWAVALGLLLFAILSPPAAIDELDRTAAAQPAAASPPVQPVPARPEGSAPAASSDALPAPVRAAAVEDLPAAPAAEVVPTAIRPAAAPRPRQPPPPAPSPAPVTVAQRTAPAAPRPAAAAAPAKPSFDCRFASGAAEQAVCRDSHLAFLDERMAVQYSQSWGKADEAKRAALLETRGGFVERRDGCTSDSCIADVYLDRMREISDIMGGQRQLR